MLGAPTSVINYCLNAFAMGAPIQIPASGSLDDALCHAKQTVIELERMVENRPHA